MHDKNIHIAKDIYYSNTTKERNLLKSYLNMTDNEIISLYYNYLTMKMKTMKMKTMKMKTMKMKTMKMKTMKMNTMKMKTMKMNTMKMNTMKMNTMKMKTVKTKTVKKERNVLSENKQNGCVYLDNNKNNKYRDHYNQ